MAYTKSKPGVASYPDFDKHSVEPKVTQLASRLPNVQSANYEAEDEVIERARPSTAQVRRRSHGRVKRSQEHDVASNPDLADPAYAAMLVAKNTQLNDSLLRIAEDRARDLQSHAIEIDRLEKMVVAGTEALADAEAKAVELEKDLAHAREIISAVRGSAPYQLKTLVNVFACCAAIFSALLFAYTYFSF